MFEPLLRFLASLMCRVRVNQTEHQVQDGVPVIIKRRRFGSGIVVWFGNLFLRLSCSGVRMFVRREEWSRWEAYCSTLLYPDHPGVTLCPGSVIRIVEAPGTSLRQLMAEHQIDVKPIIAAARELRRVHQTECNYFGSAWSHGDLHLDNILYDPVADRAVLVDFDTRHEFNLPHLWRHGDDLKVFLFELLSLRYDSWLELATAFLVEYADTVVLEELNRQLIVPRGFARILWYTRTNCSPAGRTEERMKLLRQRIQHVTAIGCS